MGIISIGLNCTIAVQEAKSKVWVSIDRLRLTLDGTVSLGIINTINGKDSRQSELINHSAVCQP
ncbi:threonine-tRNA ligase [Serratia liquefaciens FK01]|nr:threonine-tRNA ligase [Serratia liquefaciens FK01]